jgi:hypothetical protein
VFAKFLKDRHAALTSSRIGPLQGGPGAHIDCLFK